MFALLDHAKEADICLLWPREHLTLGGGGGGGKVRGRVSDAEGMRRSEWRGEGRKGRVAYCIRALQGSTIRLLPGLMNFVSAVAYHFCLNLPAAFSLPGNSLIQTSPLTVTPSGHGQKCHCNQIVTVSRGNLLKN